MEAAAEEKAEEKEEGTLVPIDELLFQGYIFANISALQRRRSQTRTWVSAFSTKLLLSLFEFAFCLGRRLVIAAD